MALTYIRYAGSDEPGTPPTDHVYEWYDSVDRTIKYKLDDGTIIVPNINPPLTSTDDLPEGVVNLYFTDERAQDAVGAALTNTATISLTYNDPGNQITADINALSITDSLISTSAAIALAKLASLSTHNRVLVSDGSGVITESSVTTTTLGFLDATSSIQTQLNAKQATLTPGSISTSTTGVTVGSGANSTVGPNVTVNVATADATHTGLLTSADWSTFNSKLTPSLTNTHLFVGNGSNVATDVALSGDATLANTGALTISAGAITDSKVSASAAISYSKLALSNSIVDSDINSVAAISYSKLALSGSIIGTDISASAAIPYSKLNLATSILNSDISTSAAIALTKLAALSSHNRVLVSNGSGVITESSTTTTTLGFLDATSSIQTQLDSKLVSPLTTKGDLLGYSTTNARVPVGSDGQVLTADSAQTLGVKWATPAATGLTSINSDTTAAQTLSIGTAGTDFAIVDAGGGSHVFNLPAATATHTGKLTSTDWSTFNSKLTSTLTSAHLFVGNGSNVATDVAVSGDLTLANTGAFTIAAGAVDNSKVSNTAAIAYSKLALTNSIVNADIASAAAIAYSKLALTNSIVNADIATAAAIAYSKLALSNSIVNADINSAAAIAYSKLNLSGSIVNADVATGAAIAFSKLASLTSAHILVGNGSNVATDTAVTGDVTITNAGVTAIGVNKVTNSQLAQMTTHTIKGNASGSTANAADLTASQVRTVAQTSYQLLTFKPQTAATSGSTFKTWSALYTELSLSKGSRVVTIDGTDDSGNSTSDVFIPAGTYDLTGVELTGIIGNDGAVPTVYLDDGCIISGLLHIGDTLNVVSNSTVNPSMTYNGGGNAYFLIGRASSIAGSTTAPLILIDGTAVFFIMGPAAGINNNGYETVDVENGSTIAIFGDIATTVANDTIRGSADSNTLAFIEVGSAQFNPTQSNFSGTTAIFLDDDSTQHAYSGTSVPSATTTRAALDNIGNVAFSVDTVTMTSTGNHTIVDGVGFLEAHGATTIALYTIKMPANPLAGQSMTISSDVQISGLTLQANTGQSFQNTPPSTLAAGAVLRYKYNGGTTKWWNA